MHSSSIVSERVLREIYLSGFEYVIEKARPLAIMSSYNKLNGVHTPNNYDLCMNAAECIFIRNKENTNNRKQSKNNRIFYDCFLIVIAYDKSNKIGKDIIICVKPKHWNSKKTLPIPF